MAKVTVSGSVTTANDTFVIEPLGDNFLTIQAYGTFSAAVLTFKGYVGSSAVYSAVQGMRADGSALESTTASLSAAMSWRLNIAGMRKVEVFLTSISTGTVNLYAATDNVPSLYLAPALADGQSGVIYDNNLVLDTVGYSQATVTSASTDTALTTAVTAKKLRVLSMTAACNGTATLVQVNSKGTGAGTIVWGTAGLAVNSNVVLPFNKHGWFQSGSGEGLTVTTGSGGVVGVNVSYIAV